MEENNYMVCWTDANGRKQWEVISGEDEMQVIVSGLSDTSPQVFAMSDELDEKSNDDAAANSIRIIKTPIGSISINRTSDPLYPGVYVSVDETSLVLVEYDQSESKHTIRVWNQHNPENDPEYVQVIDGPKQEMDIN